MKRAKIQALTSLQNSGKKESHKVDQLSTLPEYLALTICKSNK
jgi:hypothetical protein